MKDGEMIMYRFLKIRIYPNSNQKKIITDTINGCRFVRNQYIEYINENGFFAIQKVFKNIESVKIS